MRAITPMQSSEAVYIKHGDVWGDVMGNPNLANMDKSAKPQLTVGSNVCQCANCHRFFSGVKPFDRHLGGVGTSHPNCLSEAKMLAIGMEQNIHGVWQYGVSKEVAEARQAEFAL